MVIFRLVYFAACGILRRFRGAFLDSNGPRPCDKAVSLSRLPNYCAEKGVGLSPTQLSPSNAISGVGNNCKTFIFEVIRMKTIRGFIEALRIIAKYSPMGLDEVFFLQAEHDIIYSDISDEIMPEASVDGRRLQELGWHVNIEMDVWAYRT